MKTILAWLKGLFTNRYIKSAVRYVLAALVGLLVGSDIPGLADLGAFIETHAGELTDIFAGLVAALLAYWSVSKNMDNANK